MCQLPVTSGFPANVFKLENGLTVIHQYIAATPVAVVDVWVRAGAIVEPANWSGMAHFLEHMIFKGTQIMPPGYFDQIIENRGGIANAATSHDYAHYFLTTAANDLEDTLPALAELLLNAAIPDDEFVLERDVVLEEIRQALDNPDWLGFQALIESVYQRHPYGRPVLGTEELLLQYSPYMMRSFHRAYYQPHNMTVVIVGGVTEDIALKLISESFQNFQSPWECPPNELEAEPPMTEIRRQKICLSRLEQGRLMMAWTGPGVDHLPSAFGLDLLSVLLAEGRCSRLVRYLREEKGLVQSIGSSFSLQRDSSLFTINAWLEPQNANLVEELIGEFLNDLLAEPVPETELNRCKRLLCNDYAFSTETPNQLAGLYGYYNTIAEAEIAVTYPQQIQQIQSIDIQRLVSQYISPGRYAVTVLEPI